MLKKKKVGSKKPTKSLKKTYKKCVIKLDEAIKQLEELSKEAQDFFSDMQLEEEPKDVDK